MPAGVPAGERSNLSARAFTLLGTCGGERVAGADEAGPDADLGVALGVDRAPLMVAWRGRVAAAMSMPCLDRGGGSCAVVVYADL